MLKLTIKALLLILISLYLSGCGEMGFNNWRWHQKMTVEVEVNGKIITGPAVTSIHWWPNFFSGGWGGASWHSKVKGEAVKVDLGEGKYLFALLSYTRNHEYTANLATRSLYDTTKRVWIKEAFNSVLTRQKPIVVPRKVYPLLVTFEDVKDPKTVKKVDPDNLAASFGEGYRLKAITLDITDESVSKGKIDNILACLVSGKACVSLNRNLPYSDPMANILNGAFWR